MLRLLPTLLAFSLLGGSAGLAIADPVSVAAVPVTDWKAVYGTVEARDQSPARARVGGTLVALSVSEGDAVSAGQELARIVDEKFAFQIEALTAQRMALSAQLGNAEADLKRGRELLEKGAVTTQRVEALQTGVDVLNGQIAALNAQIDVIAEQAKQGTVLAPIAGRVLDVPVTKGAVVLPGESIAVVGGGGMFLRIAVPERHAATLELGDRILLSGPEGDREGVLVRIDPLIAGGRVVAEVEIDGLQDRFVGARLLVRLPVAKRAALLVPLADVTIRAGLDFVGLQTPAGVVLRSIVPGQTHMIDGVEMVEVLSGLVPGDVVVPADEAGDE